MTYETIIFSITDGQARITLNRPSRLNSFSESKHAEIADALRQVSDPANGARMLLLSGAGRAFCAGQDLSEGQMSGDTANIDLGATVERFYAPLIKSIQALPCRSFAPSTASQRALAQIWHWRATLSSPSSRPSSFSRLFD
jgi:2-(1,2-epoxy-1,2-dihydrophenyl)acetyl-CoA isomerase